MIGKSKRVRLLEVLITLQEGLIKRAKPTELRGYQNRLEELRLEYRERTGHEYFPPIKEGRGEVYL